ncbi:MAG: methyltransferase domain-containing protein [Bacteroidota bacterium]
MKRLVSFLIRNVPRKYLQRVSSIGLKTLSIFYLGSGVQCPVCGKSYKKFLPYGRISRENALCPNCQALERHRLIWLFLKEKTSFFKDNLRVLHIAPEVCFIPRFRKMRNLDYVTGDIESPLADVKMDIHQIPMDDRSFDVSFCNHVMEHVDDDIKAMSEIHRILKPGGWAIIQVPFFPPLPEKTIEDWTITKPEDREKAFGQSDHVRKYGKDYKERLEQAGFHVEESGFVATLDKDIQNLYALPKDEIIYFCKKSA